MDPIVRPDRGREKGPKGKRGQGLSARAERPLDNASPLAYLLICPVPPGATMSLLKSLALVGFGFWLGVTSVDPNRGWALAGQVGRGLVWAGEKLIDAADGRVYAGHRGMRSARERRAFFG